MEEHQWWIIQSCQVRDEDPNPNVIAFGKQAVMNSLEILLYPVSCWIYTKGVILEAAFSLATINIQM